MEDMKELFKALLAFQGMVVGVKRDSKNPHFRSSYASLEGVVAAIRDPMQKAGLVYLQLPGDFVDGSIEIETIIAHAESGQSIKQKLKVPVAKKDAQGVGSAITYGCRYSLMAMLGIPPTDDDGNAASSRDSEGDRPPQKSAQSKQAPAPSSDPAHVRAFMAAVSEIIPLFGLKGGGAVFDLLRTDLCFADIPKIKISNARQMSEFLAERDAEEVEGWVEAMREAIAEKRKEVA